MKVTSIIRSAKFAAVIAAAFALFGDTMRVFRAVMALVYALFAAGVVGVSARFFGRGAAIVAAVYLTLPPFFLPYKLLTSDGAYASVAVLALLAVWICLSADEALSRGHAVAGHMARLGFVAGLGVGHPDADHDPQVQERGDHRGDHGDDRKRVAVLVHRGLDDTELGDEAARQRDTRLGEQQHGQPDRQ